MWQSTTGWMFLVVYLIGQFLWIVHYPLTMHSKFFQMLKIISSRNFRFVMIDDENWKTIRIVRFRIFHGLLLVIDPSTLINSLPVDSSSTLSTLVRHVRSSYSLSRLSVETGIPIGQVIDTLNLFNIQVFISSLVRLFVSYLILSIGVERRLFIRFSSIIFTLFHQMLIYRSKTKFSLFFSTLSKLSFRDGSLSKLYKKTFRDTSNYRTLQEALAEYSDAITLYDHLARNDDPELTVNLIYFRKKEKKRNWFDISARSSSMCWMVSSLSSSYSGTLLLLSCSTQRRSKWFQRRISTHTFTSRT